jgi:SAM-dependent methyltransferase
LSHALNLPSIRLKRERGEKRIYLMRTETPDQIRADIKRRFAAVAVSPQQEKKFPVGAASAKRLGYDGAEIDAMPTSVTNSFAGVGDPLALGQLREGNTVLDLGCGAGLDSIRASRRVGPAGRVIGVDFSVEMVEKAKRNAKAVGANNAEFRNGEADALSVEDGSVDIVISNGVFNLCLDKPKVLAEVFRVLRPGGRVQMADIFLDDSVTPEDVARKGTWSD